MQNMGINQLAQMYMGNPQPLAAKVQQAQQGQKPGAIPQDLEAAIALQKIQEMRNAAQTQQAMQAGGPQPTVVDQLKQALAPQQAMPQQGMPQQGMPQGVHPQAPRMVGAAQPHGIPEEEQRQPAHGADISQLPSNLGQNYQGGGIIAFAGPDGSEVPEPYSLQQQGASWEARLQAARDEEEAKKSAPKSVSDVTDQLSSLRDARIRQVRAGADTSAIDQAIAYLAPQMRPVMQNDPRIQQAVSSNANQISIPGFDRGAGEGWDQATKAVAAPDNLGLAGPARRPAPVVAAAPVAPVAPTAPAVPSDVETYLRNKFKTDEVAKGLAAEEAYKKAVGPTDTSGYDRAVEELRRRQSQFEAPKTGMPALMEYLQQIAQAPKGVGSLTAGAMGAQKVTDLQKERESNQFDLAKQILEQEQKKADVKRGYAKEVYSVNVSAAKEAGKEAYDAAIALHKSEDEAKRLQQQAEQAELDRRNNLRMERERGQTTLAAASMPGSDQRFLNELEALRLKDPAAYKAKMETWNALKAPSAGGRGQLTYDQASDNVDKLMQTPAGMTEISRMRKEAKEAGLPPPSTVEIRSQLIKDAMTASGSTYAGKMPTTGGAATGKMQAPPTGFKLD